MIIPEKINLFNAYVGGGNSKSSELKLAGVTDEVTLPNFENTSATISLAGMAGEVDSPSKGQYKSVQIEIPFSNISPEMFEVVKDDSKTLVLRAAQEQIDTESLAKSHVGRVITVKGLTKSVNYGKLKKGGYGEPSITKEVIYYKDQLDGEVLTEIDKFNGKSIVAGENIMEDVEALI